MLTKDNSVKPQVNSTSDRRDFILENTEECLHFTRVAHSAAVSGDCPRSVFFVLNHIASLLDDMTGSEFCREIHIELSALCEYADSAISASCGVIQGEKSRHDEINLLLKKIEKLVDYLKGGE